MKANHGYKDGSGDYFITIDTDKCTGCGKCVEACPCPPQAGGKVLAMITDESDPFREIPIASVTDEHRRKIKYSCAPCKPMRCQPAGSQAGAPADAIQRTSPQTLCAEGTPANRPPLPCMQACEPNAISHSW